MNAANLFYYTATGCLIIMVLLGIYIAQKFVQTLEEIDLFLKDMRQISEDVQNAPRKSGSGMWGLAANVLQFFLR